MFIVYNGFSQNGENSKRSKITTFPNGDEAITIIENSDTNVIQLTRTENYNKYEMLDLSNHEAAHRSSKKRGIMRTETAGQNGWSYTVRNPNKEAKDEKDGDGSGSS